MFVIRTPFTISSLQTSSVRRLGLQTPFERQRGASISKSVRGGSACPEHLASLWRILFVNSIASAGHFGRLGLQRKLYTEKFSLKTVHSINSVAPQVRPGRPERLPSAHGDRSCNTNKLISTLRIHHNAHHNAWHFRCLHFKRWHSKWPETKSPSLAEHYRRTGNLRLAC